MFEIRLHRSYVHPFFSVWVWRRRVWSGAYQPTRTDNYCPMRRAFARTVASRSLAPRPQRCLKQIGRACTGRRDESHRGNHANFPPDEIFRGVPGVEFWGGVFFSSETLVSEQGYCKQASAEQQFSGRSRLGNFAGIKS